MYGEQLIVTQLKCVLRRYIVAADCSSTNGLEFDYTLNFTQATGSQFSLDDMGSLHVPFLRPDSASHLSLIFAYRRSLASQHRIFRAFRYNWGHSCIWSVSTLPSRIVPPRCQVPHNGGGSSNVKRTLQCATFWNICFKRNWASCAEGIRRLCVFFFADHLISSVDSS